MFNKIRINIWFIVLASCLFGGFALWLVSGMLADFEYSGEVDSNAIAVALVAVVSLILGYVLGLNQNVGQALVAPEDKPAPDPAITEKSHLETIRLVADKDGE